MKIGYGSITRDSSPVGTTEPNSTRSIVHPGLQFLAHKIPAINRWATVECPSGTAAGDCTVLHSFVGVSLSSPSKRKPANPAFTLLEVILSLAILAGALAALGEVMRLADRSASTAEDETQAQILATSIIEELSAGSRELAAVQQSPLDNGDDPPWVYSIDMEQTQYDELVCVRVRVEQLLEARLQPAHFELVRWMPNPNYVPPDTGDDSSTSSTTGTSSSATSSSSTSSGSGGQK